MGKVKEPISSSTKNCTRSIQNLLSLRFIRAGFNCVQEKDLLYFILYEIDLFTQLCTC